MKQFKQIRPFLKRTFKTKRNQRRAIYVAGAVAILALAVSLIVSQVSSHTRASIYHKRLKNLTQSLTNVQKQKATSEAEVKAKAVHEADLLKQVDELKKQVQIKKEKTLAAARAAQAVPTVAYQPQTSLSYQSSAIAGCGDNFYANFIYSHESGCRTHNPNGSGCDGIGQACPASKVINVCGYDYACQNIWFTSYANKYGGWLGSYNFWLGHGWW